MVRYLLSVLIISSLAVSCASKKKAEEEVAAEGTPDQGIETSAMTFDPNGSDSGNIPGLASIYFEFDQSRLTTEARRVLAENADWIRSKPDLTVQVEGHCDERGSIEYNLALGERRAQSVKQYLVSLGVDGERMRIISYGEEKPIDPGHNEAAWARNRRANFVPLPQ